MRLSNYEVIDCWYNGCKGNFQSHTGNLWTDDDFLYSYYEIIGVRKSVFKNKVFAYWMLEKKVGPHIARFLMRRFGGKQHVIFNKTAGGCGFHSMTTSCHVINAIRHPHKKIVIG